MTPDIDIRQLTKDYGQGKGVFDASLTVRKGETVGFLGPNGAGKSTTIRQLMGFIRPDGGQCFIRGMDCFRQAAAIQRKLGYLAGELALPPDMTGAQMLSFIARMKGLRDQRRMQELVERFELDARGSVRKMSKGTKQKLGIVCAFMGDPDILILDEPTSGLDPLMQNRFIELVLEEKGRGKTIFMSSHLFEEVERTCDRIAIIRAGRIVSVKEMEELSRERRKTYRVLFASEQEARRFAGEAFDIRAREGAYVAVAVGPELPALLKALTGYAVEDMDIQALTLEEQFLHFYGEERTK